MLNTVTSQHSTTLLRDLLGIVDYELLRADAYERYVDAEDCVLLVHVHILPSTVALFERLIALGFRPEAIVIVPKIYSTIPDAKQSVRQLGCVVVEPDSDRVLPGYYDNFGARILDKGVDIAAAICKNSSAKRCILVDDGGILTDSWSRRGRNTKDLFAVSVQQTASGLYRQRLNSDVRRINVATSAAKVHFESHIIVSGVLRKVKSLHLIKNVASRVAIIGMGALGSKLGVMLKDHQLFTYDTRRDKGAAMGNREQSWQSCVNKADIVFGCTGKNFMHFDAGDISDIRKRKCFISLSSRDVEFRSLLLTDRHLWTKYAAPTDRVINTITKRTRPTAFDNIEIKTYKDTSLIVYNGGFPINFDRTREWEGESDISLTRGLVLIAILQSLCVPTTSNPKAIEKLAIHPQQRLVGMWLEKKDQNSDAYGVSADDFFDRSWWLRTSK